MTTARKILGVLICCFGVASIAFGIALIIDQQSWLMMAGFVMFACLGLGLINLGYAVIIGRGVRTAVLYLLFISRQTPRR